MIGKVAVIGDYMLDIDTNLTKIGITPDHNVPIVIANDDQVRPGAAGAVIEMMRGFGIDAIAIGENIKQKCVKHRFFISGKPLIRKDNDHIQPITDEQADKLVQQIPFDVDCIAVSDYGKGVVTEYLWKLLWQTGKKLIVDPSRYHKLDWYQGAWAIVPNSIEANCFTVDQGFVRCECLIQIYPHVCIKLGSRGMVVGTKGEASRHIEGILIDPIDTCGAGDMVLSAICCGLLSGKSWYDSCVYANKMAAKKCMQIGSTAIQSEVLA